MQAISGFRLTTNDLPGLVRFYREVLGCSLDGDEQPISVREIAVLGLRGSGRRQNLLLGQQAVRIDAFEHPGRPYPDDSDAASPWFQHLAIVVASMASAYPRVRGAAAISRGGPQLLPRSSGGVIAFKFRDPDGHPLELLQFPADAVPATWQGKAAAGDEIGLGIDHSAITATNLDASISFYMAAGLQRQSGTNNEGPAQQRLDGLADARVHVLPMLPASGTPHLELLAYENQHRDGIFALQANDVAATRIVWSGVVSRLLRDPDGHLHQVDPSPLGVN